MDKNYECSQKIDEGTHVPTSTYLKEYMFLFVWTRSWKCPEIYHLLPRLVIMVLDSHHTIIRLGKFNILQHLRFRNELYLIILSIHNLPLCIFDGSIIRMIRQTCTIDYPRLE